MAAVRRDVQRRLPALRRRAHLDTLPTHALAVQQMRDQRARASGGGRHQQRRAVRSARHQQRLAERRARAAVAAASSAAAAVSSAAASSAAVSAVSAAAVSAAASSSSAAFAAAFAACSLRLGARHAVGSHRLAIGRLEVEQRGHAAVHDQVGRHRRQQPPPVDAEANCRRRGRRALAATGVAAAAVGVAQQLERHERGGVVRTRREHRAEDPPAISQDLGLAQHRRRQVAAGERGELARVRRRSPGGEPSHRRAIVVVATALVAVLFTAPVVVVGVGVGRLAPSAHAGLAVGAVGAAVAAARLTRDRGDREL